jgi:hypothetical protein
MKFETDVLRSYHKITSLAKPNIFHKCGLNTCTTPKQHKVGMNFHTKWIPTFVIPPWNYDKNHKSSSFVDGMALITYRLPE